MLVWSCQTHYHTVQPLPYETILYFLEIYKSAEEFLESTLSNNNGATHPGYVAQPPMVSNPIINLEIMLLVLIAQLIVHVYVNSQTETINGKSTF